MARQLLSSRDRKMLPILRKRAHRAQQGLCYWCKDPIYENVDEKHSQKLTADHLVPLHDGGKTEPGNIVAACRKCNNGRHPYLNKKSVAIKLTAGDDTPRSPFLVLKSCKN